MKSIVAALLVLALTACSPQQVTGDGAQSATPSRESPASAAAAPLAPPDDDAGALLPHYHWQLAGATDASGRRIDALFARPDRPLTLDFADHSMLVANACNRMRAGYAMAADRMEVGDFASTLMACPDPGLMALDRAVGRYLHGALAVALDATATPPTLTLTTAADDRLVFDGVPTPETRFGSKGTTEFLEVAPASRPCNDPGRPGAQCLEVRELHYDAQGLRTGQPGAWHVLGQPIEGFTHTPGVRNVLRVTRYAVPNPPADAPSAAYVLDMVVESGAPASR